MSALTQKFLKHIRPFKAEELALSKRINCFIKRAKRFIKAIFYSDSVRRAPFEEELVRREVVCMKFDPAPMVA